MNAVIVLWGFYITAGCSGGIYGMVASTLFGAATGVNICAIKQGPSSTPGVVS